jgi:predicted exporter
VLFAITNFLGIALPINGLFILGFMFILLLNINFTIFISDLTDKNSKIIQKLALLELELNSFKK